MGQFDDLFEPRQANPRLAVQLVGDTKPEDAAGYVNLAKRYKVPVPLVETFPDEYKARARADDIDTVTKPAPRLRSWLSDTSRAKIALDDVSQLTEIEKAVQTFGSISEWKGPEPTTLNIIKGLAQSVPQAGRAIRAGLQVQMTDFLQSVGLITLDPVDQTDRDRKLAQAMGAADFTRPNFETRTASAVYGGVESFLRAIPGLAASIATRSPTPALLAAGGQTQAEAYGKYRARGGSPGESFMGATGEGLVEIATEYLPAKYLAETLGKEGAKQFILNFLKKDALGEQAATLLQDAIDTAVANPDKTWEQYLAERPGAAYETLVATITQAGLMTGLNSAVRRLAASDQQGAEAQTFADNLKAGMTAAATSALRERTPEQFRELMQTMSEGSVYVDGEVLNQLPPEVLSQLPAEVQAQVTQAAAIGDTVAIPVADVLTIAPGTPLEQTIIEHARATPDALSQADAKAAQSKADELVAEAERVIEQAADQEALRQSQELVKTNIKEQLAATGRFRDAVADGYATWAAAFFTAYGSRMGMTPEAFYQRYPLRVLGAPSAQGGQVMDQIADPEFAARVAAAAPDILTHYKVARGLALPKTAKLWRGETVTTGTHSAVYGRGLYVTADKKQAQEFAGKGGILREMTTADLPQNPLRFDSINDYQVWEQDARERLGLKRASEFSAKVKDVADFVRALDPSVDGVQIGKGRDSFFVKYPAVGQPQTANSEQGRAGELGQGETPRGTFNPATLELVLNPNANLSTFFHETGHFFLEVLADVASQPDAPAQIVEDMSTFLKWAGIPDLQTWNSYTLDQKRPYHERWAESVEQYVMEGKAPSVELQPLMRRFAAWLKSIYQSIKQFAAGKPDLALNDDIRRVMDRMLATDEQIAQANEVAGLVPDVEADAEAAERLNKRSMADLKWAVKARDAVIAKLRRQAREIEKGIRAEVTVEVNQMPEMRAKRALDALKITPEHEGMLRVHAAERQAAEQAERDRLVAELYDANPDVKGLKRGQLLAKNRREINNKVEAFMIEWDRANPKPTRPMNASDQDVATVADSFGYASVEEMLQAIEAFGSRQEAIDGMTQQRMLEEHGDLIDDRAIAEAANAAVHNEARARSLASELRTQREMLNARTDTGETNARGARITVNALAEAAKQFAANVVARTPLRDLKATAWKHTAAERRAAKRWAEATAAGKTEDAVKAKQDQMLNHAAARAALDAQAEARKIVDFFRRVTKGNDETVVEKGRDPDIVNAARAVLAAYGMQSPVSKGAVAYLEALKTNDPDTYGALEPMVAAATANAQPIEALTFEELQGLAESVRAMWFLAKRSRQMEVDGNLLDLDDAAQELFARMEEIGIPDRVPGEGMAITKEEERGLFIKQGVAFLRRVEQWAEGMDGKYGGPFLRLVFQPIKDAADRYRADRITYRKRFQALVDNLAPIVGDSVIRAPELGYTFGTPGSTAGTAMNEILHAIAHTGNESNKRKLLLGRGWATENPDGTLDTSRWDAFIRRLVNEGKLQKEHFDFVQGVWDLLEETKPLAQKAHRDAFGRFFNEVTADAFVDPFGVPRRGGYVPAQVDTRLVKDNALRKLAEEENNSMAFAFPQPAKGFTMARVDYNRELLLDLRGLSQHIDKVLLFGHMTNPARDVRKLLTRKTVSQPLDRIQPAAIESMLQPWLQRSAQQVVEEPIVGSGKWARVPGIIRARAGAALMFANVSNAIQQVTGLSTAMVKVGPGHMMRALAQHVAHPVEAARAVWALSSYMDDRAKNEVAVMNEQMQAILIKPSVYERAQDWSMRHAYFLQTAIDNALSPIVWTGAYNQALAEGMSDADAVRFADGTVRQTQGSTLPEDVSRFETGPAYARAFTQFVGYFNMVANTNATALKQIAGEVGLKKGAGRAFSVVMLGLMVPIWVAEAIALAFKGGPDDEDKDGVLIDDWLASVFGFGTAKGLLAMIPIAGQAANSAVTRLDNNPMNDRISLSPGLSLLESALGGNVQTVYEILSEDKEVNARRAVRDAATLVSVFTGIPVYAVARPAGYTAGVIQGKIEPTSPADAARGLITGTPSPESKQR